MSYEHHRTDLQLMAVQPSVRTPAQRKKESVATASRILAILAENYGRQVSADLVKIWAGALEPRTYITDAIASKTVERLIATRKFMPVVAEFLEVARCVIADERSTLADTRPALEAREETAEERAARLEREGMDAASRARMRGNTPLARSVDQALRFTADAQTGTAQEEKNDGEGEREEDCAG